MREDVRSEVGYIAPIEGMRGVAVLWVVAFHYLVVRSAAGIADPWIAALAREPALEAIALNGYLGVDLFFLVSGFLLALPWLAHARAGMAPPSARGFYARRIRRIVPAYYLQLLFLFTLVLPLLHGRKYWRSDVYVDLWNGVAHGLFIHNTTPLTSGSLGVNGALWTLAVEAQFYVLLPLVAPLFARAPRRALAAAVALALAWQWDAAHDLAVLVDAELRMGAHWAWTEAMVREVLSLQLPAFAAHFALGIVLGRWWLRSREAPKALSTLTRALLCAAALAILALQFAGLIPIPKAFARMPATLALAILLALAASLRPGALTNALARGPLAFAGRISYSAYLYHVPLLLLWNVYARGIWAWLSLPAYATALAAISWASWRYVEQPFIGTKRRAGRGEEGREDIEALERAES
jgi:peptidoglycan/LPS O-acetylase OafA/YrhL